MTSSCNGGQAGREVLLLHLQGQCHDYGGWRHCTVPVYSVQYYCTLYIYRDNVTTMRGGLRHCTRGSEIYSFSSSVLYRTGSHPVWTSAGLGEDARPEAGLATSSCCTRGCCCPRSPPRCCRCLRCPSCSAPVIIIIIHHHHHHHYHHHLGRVRHSDVRHVTALLEHGLLSLPDLVQLLDGVHDLRVEGLRQ